MGFGNHLLQTTLNNVGHLKFTLGNLVAKRVFDLSIRPVMVMAMGSSVTAWTLVKGDEIRARGFFALKSRFRNIEAQNGIPFLIETEEHMYHDVSENAMNLPR